MRQEWSAALSPESFLGGAASLRWCVVFRLRWRSSLLLQAFAEVWRYATISLTTSERRVGVWAAPQRLIPTGERSGLQTRIATTESVALCAPGEKLGIAKALPKERQ